MSKLVGVPIVRVEVDSLGNVDVNVSDPRYDTHFVSKLLATVIIDAIFASIKPLKADIVAPPGPGGN